MTDLQFHANQENENFQHELQLFMDFGDDITLTTGLFYYENTIDQRLDFWSTGLSRYRNAASYGVGSLLEPTNPFLAWQTARVAYGTDQPQPGLGSDSLVPASLDQVGWSSARDACRGNPVNPLAVAAVPNLRGAQPFLAFSDPHVKTVCLLQGPWLGDSRSFANGNTPSGPATEGTSFIWNTVNSTEASAIYAQGGWQINNLFALTLGLRWAEDKKVGEESLYLYQEEQLTSANLLAYNQATGALDAAGNPTGAAPIRFRGLPYSASIYREVENEFDDITWRVNVDYTPNDNELWYLSATTGSRAGGFNLGFFSTTPTYDPEDVLALELGYKGQHLDGTLQVNGSLYRYDYENVHLQFVGQSALGPSTSVRNHPGAINQGLELEVLWLATNELTLGGNYSYSDATYDGEFVDVETGAVGLVDNNNPFSPATLYPAAERSNRTDGNQLQRVPEEKWALCGQYRLEIAQGTVDFLTSVAWTDEVRFDITDSPSTSRTSGIGGTPGSPGRRPTTSWRPHSS